MSQQVTEAELAVIEYGQVDLQVKPFQKRSTDSSPAELAHLSRLLLAGTAGGYSD